ncbi:glycosyltransferase [Streptomyces sp. NPDC048111]|uniref:glycosyltransferase family 2 protein n=1 Tax=Streptomyces sp. NPDC048111 TaxID=3365500 RepID=UPI00371F93E7
MTHRHFSVVICVYTEDRWEDILAAVSSVRAQSLPALETLLVVDHNERLRERLGREFGRYAPSGEVRVLANAGPRGLSAGRNTAIAVARGEFVAFLDDDAVAERDWLRHFAQGYDDPRVMAVGGRTLPVWSSGRRPGWFPEEFDWIVGCTYRGLPPGRVEVRNVLGGNASFRRSAFDAAGGFATGIGRDGDKRPLGCEETELCIRLSRALPGSVLLIDDRAVIHHRVPAARERFGYFRTRAYAEGLSKALVARSVGADKGLESERRYTTRVLPAGVARGVRDAVLGRAGGAGRAGAIVAGVALAAGGYLVGAARAARSGGGFTVAPIERVRTPRPDAGPAPSEPAGTPASPEPAGAPAGPEPAGESASAEPAGKAGHPERAEEGEAA